MAYKVIILYRLYMPSYFLGTFTEYPKTTERQLCRPVSSRISSNKRLNILFCPLWYPTFQKLLSPPSATKSQKEAYGLQVLIQAHHK